MVKKIMGDQVGIERQKDKPPYQEEKDLSKIISTSTDGVSAIGRETNSGMNLKFVPPTIVNGIPIAKLDAKEANNMINVWKKSVVVYVVGIKPTVESLKIYINAGWLGIHEYKVFEHEEGYFIIQFKASEDCDNVLKGGPYFMGGRPVIVKQWCPGFDMEKEILKNVPVWVRFPNLPLFCWGVECLSRIASVLGVPIMDDDNTMMQKRISYARVLIDIDVTQDLPECIKVEGLNGDTFDQKLVFDWVPPFCEKCKKAGHQCGEKQKGTLHSGKIRWVKKWVVKQVPEQSQNEEISEEAIKGVESTPKQPLEQQETDGEGWTQLVRKRTSKNPQSVFQKVMGDKTSIVERLDFINNSPLAPSLCFVEG